MRKIVSIFLAFLILYNILGYVIVFKSYQYAIRREVKKKIKNSLTDYDLIIVRLTETDIRSNKNGYKKINNNEFRLSGKLYDIVRSKINGDTSILYCINDTREEQLFSNLDAHVKYHMDNNIPLKERSNTLFKIIVKQALLYKNSFVMPEVSSIAYMITNSTLPEYFKNNIPSPPPKNQL